MTPGRIKGATHRMGAPKGWERDKHGHCADLYVRQDGNVYESAWEPTPDELAAIAAGKPIILRIVGSQPPVMIEVEGTGVRR